MSYYKEKKQALALIEKLASQAQYTAEEIAFNVLRLTGFSKSMVNNYIGNGLQNGLFYMTKEGMVTTIRPNEAKKDVPLRDDKPEIKK